MNLFLKARNITSEWGSTDYIDLCVKRKYKSCINRIKYKDLVLCSLTLDDLSKLKLYKDDEIKDFMIKQFLYFKENKRIDRNLYKTFNKIKNN